jgi:DNA repair ATPase RecN
MTHIIQCSVENIGGAELVEFAPHGQTVTIGGPNRAGKSSAINALVAALGGKSLLPADPVRHGAESGTVRIELDQFLVTLEVDADRSSKLKVESKEGARYQSPQAMLDRLFGGLSFNPGAFRSMEDKKRKAVLMQLAKLDLSDLDAAEKAAETDRAYKKKRAAELEAVGKSYPADPQAPAARIDVSALLAEVGKAQQHNAEIEKVIFTHRQLCKQVAEKQEQVAELKERIEELEDYILDAHTRLANMVEVANSPLIDLGELQAKISNAELLNRKFDQHQAREKIIADWKAIKSQVNQAEDQIDAIRQDRANRLAAAPFPIEGLGFSDGDVTFNGIPFAQLSESEQWEVSTAIGFALNPKGILFMSASGGLDAKARDRIRARAAAAGVQLFLEVVDDQKDVQVLIEEGKVKEIRL